MKKLEVKKIVLSALLLATGLVLHQIEPAIFGVKPDMLLIMLFLTLLINKDNFKVSIICGVIAGLFSAMTTAFPGGQLPNIIDKVITTIVCYLLIKLLNKKVKDTTLTIVLMSVGTAISGFVFLLTAKLLVGLPGGMSLAALYVAVTIPAIIINSVLGTIVSKVFKRIM